MNGFRSAKCLDIVYGDVICQESNYYSYTIWDSYNKHVIYIGSECFYDPHLRNFKGARYHFASENVLDFCFKVFDFQNAYGYISCIYIYIL